MRSYTTEILPTTRRELLSLPRAIQKRSGQNSSLPKNAVMLHGIIFFFIPHLKPIQNEFSIWPVVLKKSSKTILKNTERKEKTSPLMGREEGGGKRADTHSKIRRKHSTDTEGRLWGHLRNRRIEAFQFRRQQILPLTLALSPKGRGQIISDQTSPVGRRSNLYSLGLENDKAGCCALPKLSRPLTHGSS